MKRWSPRVMWFASAVVPLVGVGCGGGDDGTNALPAEDASTDAVEAGADADASADGTVDADAPVDAVEEAIPGCTGTPNSGTVSAFRDPSSSRKAAAGALLHLPHVVATSPKFLVQRSNTGTCLYGVFVADPAAAFAPWSGLLVTSFGKTAVIPDGSTRAYCLDGGGAIPDGVARGDLLDVAGTYSLVGPTATACGSTPLPVPATQPRLDDTCALVKIGTSAVPAPADVTPESLLGGDDAVLQWAGGLVRVRNVIVAGPTDGGSPMIYGSFLLYPSGLGVGSTIYASGVGAPRPSVTTDEVFTSIVGEGYLDFCTWSLEPRSPCDGTPSLSPDAGACP